MKRFLAVLTFLSFVCAHPAFAQAVNDDFMRSTGKIYVVVAVIVLAFLGIVAYLVRMDKKLTKLENQINNNGKS
ncbi:MAG: CcmD family protein [Bacteroidota bacterium]